MQERKLRVELACHTGFSRLNGLGLERDWIDFAVREGIRTLVVTDTGSVDGFVAFEKTIRAKKYDIKLITGADLLVFDDRTVDVSHRSGRLSVLIKNETGRKNLYEILSEVDRLHKDNDNTEVKLPLSFLLNRHEGLLIGSGADDGLVTSDYSFLDYVEISAELSEDSTLATLLNLAASLGVPAAVVSAPHYISEKQATAYRVLKNDPDQTAKHYKSTEELLKHFSFLGEEKAYELVVTNTNLIADMCERVSATQTKKMYPYIEGGDEKLRALCEKNLSVRYPEASPEIYDRLEWELKAIADTKSAFMFQQVREIMDTLNLKPYEVGFRGLVGSSIVAYLCGITELDPIKLGFSPYFFFGYDGAKEPDIDLNFSFDKRQEVMACLDNLSGVGKALHARTNGFVNNDYAYGLMIEYNKQHGQTIDREMYSELAGELTKCVRMHGTHPGGMVLLPKGVDTTDIMPSAGFDYYSIDDVVYKLDVLAYDAQTILCRLAELTGVDPSDISTDDPEVMELFKIKGDELPGCAGIYEYSSSYVFDSMKVAKVEKFDDLVKLGGLMHGTDVWENNAKCLIRDGVATAQEVMATREDVYDTMVRYGFDKGTAFAIAEDVRKGKVASGRSKNWNEWKASMIQKDVPMWLIESLEKILYIFPRTHTYIYTLTAWRIAWYKLHYPLAYFKVMLDVCCSDSFKPKYMAKGADLFGSYYSFLTKGFAEENDTTFRHRRTCTILHDFYDHGFKFEIIGAEGLGQYEFEILDEHTIGARRS